MKSEAVPPDSRCSAVCDIDIQAAVQTNQSACATIDVFDPELGSRPGRAGASATAC